MDSVTNDSAAPASPAPAALPLRARPRPLARRDPFRVTISALDLVSVLAFVTPFEGFQMIVGVGGITAPALVGYVVFALMAFQVTAMLRQQRAFFWWWALSFAIGTLITLVNFLTIGTEINSVVRTLWQGMGLLVIISYAAASEAGFRRIFKSFTLGMAAIMVLWVVFYVTGFHVVDTGERVAKVAGSQANTMGLTMVVFLVLLAGSFSMWSRTWKILLAGVAAPCAGYGLLLGNSRGSLLSLAGGIAVYLVPQQRRARFGRLQVVGIFVATALIVYFSVGRERLDELVQKQQDRWEQQLEGKDIDVRAEIREKGLELAIANPIGYGIGQAPVVLAPVVLDGHWKNIDSHNEFLRVLIESGFLGLALYGVGHLLLLGGALRVFRKQGLVWPLAVLVVIDIGFMSQSGAGYKFVWITFGLVSAALYPTRARRVGPRR